MAGPRVDLEAELDSLFALPLEEFVNARNALAKRLKAAGDAEASERAKELKKPNVVAWAVNRVRFEAPELLEALVAAGDRLREGPADVRAAIQERRDALAAARRKAEAILEAAEHAATPQTMQRVSATLDALATYGSAPGRPVAGRLVEELQPPGFEELATLGLLPAPAARTPAAPAPKEEKPPAAPVHMPAPTPSKHAKQETTPDSAELRRAQEAVRSAREASEAARRASDAASRKLAALEKSVEVLGGKRKSLESALEEARSDERRAADATAAGRKEAATAEREAAKAQKALADAQAHEARLSR